ncbi:DUF551 domain-containing protein [Escherichia coli]|uniref:DUF551 domain-containing protein n=1 Tax=Escherichia coli TaxID=562 RepID=UPI002101004F|nr:DUF551 domain-containing protein [Escherichia coli]MCQ1560930.1 DUF551 domain-containing protein [Escherichia coli]
MTTITKERLLTIKQWRETYGPGSNVVLPAEEAEELARIALASLEAEPVAWLHSDNGLGIPAITRSKNIADSWLSKGWYVQPLYIAKPVPVTPDGWISCSDRMPDKLIPVMVMYEDGEMWSAMWNGNRWDDGTEYPDPHSVTHWREMPAAPKQEVKS